MKGIFGAAKLHINHTSSDDQRRSYWEFENEALVAIETMSDSHLKYLGAGARPTKHISIEFEIRWKFRTL